jgi:hypothetical protein
MTSINTRKEHNHYHPSIHASNHTPHHIKKVATTAAHLRIRCCDATTTTASTTRASTTVSRSTAPRTAALPHARRRALLATAASNTTRLPQQRQQLVIARIRKRDLALQELRVLRQPA